MADDTTNPEATEAEPKPAKKAAKKAAKAVTLHGHDYDAEGVHRLAETGHVGALAALGFTADD